MNNSFKSEINSVKSREKVKFSNSFEIKEILKNIDTLKMVDSFLVESNVLIDKVSDKRLDYTINNDDSENHLKRSIEFGLAYSNLNFLSTDEKKNYENVLYSALEKGVLYSIFSDTGDLISVLLVRDFEHEEYIKKLISWVWIEKSFQDKASVYATLKYILNEEKGGKIAHIHSKNISSLKLFSRLGFKVTWAQKK